MPDSPEYSKEEIKKEWHHELIFVLDIIAYCQLEKLGEIVRFTEREREILAEARANLLCDIEWRNSIL